ncbi:MAG: hypothetical protein DMG30_23865 [Acidobacteria bacterium]|nr:MAG: hypothetical protein DMG30_23865 [Acidobacteriota bacterium]
MQRYCGLYVHTAICCHEEIWGGDREIDLHTVMLKYREQIQLPEAGIKCRLEFFDELAIPVLEAFCPLTTSKLN